MIDISTALYQAIEKYPYYARGFAAMVPIKKLITGGGSEPTLGVDKYWRIYWSPEAFERFRYCLAEVLRHEFEHLLREHSSRCNNRYPLAWNFAADAEINDDLENLPADCIFPSFFEMDEGLTAEAYYQSLKDHCQCKGKGEGSGVTGVTEEWEEGQPTGNEAISDETAAEEIRDQIAEDVRAQAAKDRGSVPSGVLLWAEARAKGRLPKISWRRTIRDRLRRISHGKQDFSYGRVSRRQDRGSKIILPGMIKYDPKLAVVIDTSGSMADMADWIAGVLRDISRMHAQTILIDCDAGVHAVRKLKTWRDVLKSKGGGGTDMRVGIDRALAEKADLVLVLTDGETPWPEKWPKSVVGIINNGGRTEVRRG